MLVNKARKDPGIPNLYPYKQAMLARAEHAKIAEIEERDRARDRRRAVESKKRAEAALKEQQDIEFGKSLATPEGKRKWYFKELKKVIEASDIIIQVLDARDPMGCRAHDVERIVAKQMNPDGSPSKKIVLLLNKIDLVPATVVENWIKFLRREFPCLAFKSSTQQQSSHLSSISTKPSKVDSKTLTSSSAVGAGPLLQLLKNYSRSLNLKKTINVGVIGYPNVGKSSIINSLKRSRAVQVSAAAGCTKVVQHVKLDNNINLIDSPGVLFSADNDAEKNLLLRNVLKVEQVEDPIEACKGILSRCSKEQLMEIYKIAEFSSTEEFLGFVAHRRGKLGKGGVPNYVEAARAILQDWNSGKIPFYTPAPEVKDIESSVIVNSWGNDFDINAVIDNANREILTEIASGEHKASTDYVEMAGNEEADAVEDDEGMIGDSDSEFEGEDSNEDEAGQDDEDDEDSGDMDSESNKKSISKGMFTENKLSMKNVRDFVQNGGKNAGISSFEAGGLSQRRKEQAQKEKQVFSVMSSSSVVQNAGEGNHQLNKNKKTEMKKQKKQMKRAAAKFADSSMAEDYNFESDWQ
jgi:nuclear GTP-binding protein